MRIIHRILGILACLAFLTSCSANAQTGKVERTQVHGKALEGNLEGDSPDVFVSVYLPESYSSQTSRRYPVVYFLHGFTDSDEKWMGQTKHWIHLPAILDREFAAPDAREFIVVMPNGFTRYGGSMYSNSVTTGNWEDYIVSELVPYIDQHYRTIARVESRGLAGHSMGGYGAMRLGLRHPETFSSFYVLSGCCMAHPADGVLKLGVKSEDVKSPDDVRSASFQTQALYASAAAWSPDPDKPPFYSDLPIHAGKIDETVLDRWNANAPLVILDQYVANLRKMKAIALDAGDKDDTITENTRALDQRLTLYKIPHEFAIYDGNHVNHIADRIREKVVPFFEKNLSFEPAK